MPKISKPLTVSQVKAAKPAQKLFKLSDGAGLALWVYPTGAKRWRYSFSVDGKQQSVLIGAFPDVGLAEAREKLVALRKRLREGEVITPGRKKAGVSFQAVAADWYARWAPEMSEKYAAQVWRLFERWIFPRLGAMPVGQIKTVDVVECLRIMEARGIADTLRKTKNSLGLVFSFAVGSGLAEYNPVLQIGNGVFRQPKTTNMAALPPAQLPRLIDFLEQRGEFAHPTNRLKVSPTVRLAIYWLLLTMTRVQETALMEWPEIEGDLWHVPAERKKERRAHVVPVTAAMQWVLDQARAINVNGRYVFESYNFQSHMNKEAPRVAMQRAGLDTTAHGLRSLARTYLREELKVADDVAEKLLAHSLGTKTQAAYNRSVLLEERREALERWGAVILGLVQA